MFDNIFKINLKEVPVKKQRDFLVIEPAVVDHCNLNCAYCDHITPMADKGFYDTKQFEKDFKHLSRVLYTKEIIDNYDIIFQIVGGEPFLHPDLFDFVDIILENFDERYIRQLSIMTNCTLFNQRKDLSEKYKSNLSKYRKLGFIKSHYPPYNVDKIKSDFEEFIGHEVNGFNVEDHYTFNKCNLNFNSKEYPTTCVCNSMYMRDGQICRCPIIGNAKFLLKKMNLPKNLISTEDFFNLDETFTAQKLIRLHKSLTPFCRYCLPRENGLSWRLSDFSASEWVDENYINYMRNKN